MTSTPQHGHNSGTTRRQREIYDLIHAMRDERGICPTIREIADRLGVGIFCAYRHVRALERRGLIERGSVQGRAMRLLHNPEPTLEYRGEIR